MENISRMEFSEVLPPTSGIFSSGFRFVKKLTKANFGANIFREHLG